MRRRGVLLAALLAGGACLLNAAIVYQTSFEAPVFSLGQLAGQAGWNTNGLGPASATIIENTFANPDSGTQAVEVMPTSSYNSGGGIAVSYNAAGQVLSFTMNAYLSASGQHGGWTIMDTQYNSATNPIIDFNITPNGNMQIVYPGGGYVSSATIARGAWNQYLLVVNLAKDTLSAYYNGVPVLQNQPFTPSSTTLEYVTFGGGAGTDVGYFDNFSISATEMFTTLVSFGTNDGNPVGGLIQATDGNLYGTTNGEWTGPGTVFKITPGGAQTTLYNFTGGANGEQPNGGLVQATNGIFYGTTYDGANYSGVNGYGTVFKITTAGKLTTLHGFDGADGQGPYSGLIQATNGNLYGTTENGSNTSCTFGFVLGCGTVFKITPAGTLTTLHEFDGTHGSQPAGQLTQATNGDIYGTTMTGGTNNTCQYGCGTVFKMTPGGRLTPNFCNFSPATGYNPQARLVQATDGYFYGTAQFGGAYGYGTVFKITSRGTLTVVHSFDGSDGAQPVAGLIQATDGSFYGTTYVGGAYGYGTIFEITSKGVLTTLRRC